MRRAFGWLFLLGLVAVGLLWPLAFNGGSTAAPATDPVVITNYQADFTVAEDGTLDAVETITGEFPSGRHGIFRYWDVANQNSPRVRQKPEITSILLDGEAAPYQLLWEDGERFRVAKIGDPDSTLSAGTHVYELRYAIPGVLDPGSTGENRQFATTEGDPNSTSAFFWNVIAPSWNNVIQRVHVRATLPADVTGAQCSVGFGLGTACADLTVDGNTVEFTTGGLNPRTPVTLRAGVDVPTPPRISLPWSYGWDRILGQSVTGAAWVLGLSVVAGLVGFLWYRTTVEPPPGFPVQYAPPPGLGPVQTEYIRTESVPRNGLTATLFYLAERGLVELNQVGDKEWNVHGMAPGRAWADVDPVSIAVGSALKVMSPGSEFEAEKTVTAGKKLNKAKTDMAAAVRKWAIDGGLLVKRKRSSGSARSTRSPRSSWSAASSAGDSRSPCGVCRSRRSSPPRCGHGPTASAPAGRRQVASCGRRRADSTVCCPPTRRRPGSTSAPARTSTALTSRSRSRRARQPCGRRSIRTRRVTLRHNRVGTTRRPPPAGLRGARAARTSTVSNRRCRRRSAHTPRRSPRRRRRPPPVAVRRRWRRRWRRRRRLVVSSLLILVLVVLVLVLIGFVLGYNKIRSADVRVSEALSGIDVELTRRASLIPSLVHTVRRSRPTKRASWTT